MIKLGRRYRQHQPLLLLLLLLLLLQLLQRNCPMPPIVREFNTTTDGRRKVLGIF